jgi:hypothetical protein
VPPPRQGCPFPKQEHHANTRGCLRAVAHDEELARRLDKALTGLKPLLVSILVRKYQGAVRQRTAAARMPELSPV